MDFIKQISAYLTSNATLNASIVSPILSAEPKSVAIRETPSSIANRYIDKGKTLDFQFQVLVKDPNVIIARDTINSVFDALDGLNDVVTSGDGSFIFTQCECTVLPNWVETNEHGEHIFTILFSCSLEKGGI